MQGPETNPFLDFEVVGAILTIVSAVVGASTVYLRLFVSTQLGELDKKIRDRLDIVYTRRDVMDSKLDLISTKADLIEKRVDTLESEIRRKLSD